METISRKISEFINKESKKFEPVIIDDLEKIKKIQSRLCQSTPFSPAIKTKIDRLGDISTFDYVNDGYESRSYIYKLNFPYRINFDYKQGYFMKDNVFRPRPFLDSSTEGNDFIIECLKNKFVDNVSQLGLIDLPKIIFPETFERINLSDIFGVNEILVCYHSEVPKLIPRADNNKYYSYDL